MLLLAIYVSNFTIFKSVCEDYYFVKHARGSNEYKCNIIKLDESAEDGRSLRARETDSFSCWYFLPFSAVSTMRLHYTSLSSLYNHNQPLKLMQWCALRLFETWSHITRNEQGWRILRGRLTASSWLAASAASVNCYSDLRQNQYHMPVPAIKLPHYLYAVLMMLRASLQREPGVERADQSRSTYVNASLVHRSWKYIGIAIFMA